MNKSSKFIAIRCFLIAAATWAMFPTSSQGQGAIATISQTGGTTGSFDYSLTLKNTGSVDLNSFWYGWTDFGNNLPANPSSAANSLGWANVLDFNSIQWQNTTSASALAPGQSATFTFVTASTLSQLTTGSSGQSVAYTSDTVQFNQAIAGQSSPVFSPTIVTVPEPSMGMLAIGSLLLCALRRRTAPSK
ncbi:MAG TPA: hypothetical protein VG938_05500 [Verrucomicrobiae bacterium]|jgi:hypothetical protein|nr:hypothetical protein [Verrucomicrobiae bacterium]